MQRVKKHFLVAVLMGDAWNGIEHQTDPSSFSSGISISLFITQPFGLSLIVTANMSAIFAATSTPLLNIALPCLRGKVLDAELMVSESVMRQ
jgi:hypothetical protein